GGRGGGEGGGGGGAKWGEGGEGRGGGDRAHPGHGREQILGLPPRWAGTDRVMQIRLEIPEGPLQPGNVRIDAASEPAIAGLVAAIGLRAQHLDELAAAGDELAEPLGVFRRQRADGRPPALAKAV